MNTTLQTIADKLGVTRATVSRAMRNSPEISRATCLLVQSTARELNYKPNPLVNTLMQSVRLGRTAPDSFIIAIVEGWPRQSGQNPFEFNKDFVGAITERAVSHSIKVEKMSLWKNGMTPKRAFSILKNRGIKGIIFLPFQKFGHELNEYEEYMRDFSMVAIGHTLKSPKLLRVVSDQFQNAELALVNIARLGWKRVGLVQTEDYERRVNHRQLGACLALSSELGIEVTKPLIVPDHLSFSAQRELARKWHKSEKPDAILSHGNEGLKLLADEENQLPKGLGYAAIGRLDSYPQLAGVDQCHAQVGAAAVDIVLAQFHRNEWGIPAKSRTSMIEGLWKDGSTLPNLA